MVIKGYHASNYLGTFVLHYAKMFNDIKSNWIPINYYLFESIVLTSQRQWKSLEIHFAWICSEYFICIASNSRVNVSNDWICQQEMSTNQLLIWSFWNQKHFSQNLDACSQQSCHALKRCHAQIFRGKARCQGHAIVVTIHCYRSHDGICTHRKVLPLTERVATCITHSGV